MSETVKRIIADNPVIHPGDVFVTNDPYRGGSHLPDVTVITPVHEDQTGELLFFTAKPGSSRRDWRNRPRQHAIPSRKLWRKRECSSAISNWWMPASRAKRSSRSCYFRAAGPHVRCATTLADVSAQVAANNTGVLRLRELLAR